MNAAAPLLERLEIRSFAEAVNAACRRIAPLFDVRDMVAVNPFLGFSELPFSQAALTIENIFHENILPRGESAPAAPHLLCVADRTGEQLGEACAKGPLDSLTRFLSTYVDESSASPLRDWSSLYSSYIRFASVDRTPELRGLKGFRLQLDALPKDALSALHQLLSEVDCEPSELASYLTRLLARLPGYAGYFRGQEFSSGDTLGQMPELLTILLLHDRILAGFCGEIFGPTWTEGEPGYEEFRTSQLAALEADEAETQQLLASRFAPSSRSARTRVLAQAVFCIDVRSELLRSQLERWGDIETYGFAGFFGIPMTLQGDNGSRPHCPPLLQPSLTFTLPEEKHSVFGTAKKSLARALKAPVSALGHVEAFGLASSLQLLQDAFPRNKAIPEPQTLRLDVKGIPLPERVQLAKGILKNIGLRRPLAPLVVLAGHGSHVTNNPQAASLACGACAGHGGLPNAQIAAQILNDQEVRAELDQTEHAVQNDVLFVAAEHETVTDSLQLVVPPSLSERQTRLVHELKQRVEKASLATRELRNKAVGGRLESTCKRTSDYSETQPEWALAGNAAFLVADRSLSRQTDLQGRAFLHSYDSKADEDGSVLEMILTAPAVVGSWINLQYYASTVAPRTFGSGRKTLHNLTGRVGVIEGGSGDLAIGLSRESVTDRDGQLMHRPERLHVMVQSDPARIQAIIEKHKGLRKLVEGQWIRISSLMVVDNDVLLEPISGEDIGTDGSTAVAAE